MQADVLIIGGGPTGLLAALLAAQNDFSVLVVDKQSDLRSRSHAHYLNAYSLTILVQAGLAYEDLQAMAVDEAIANRMVICHQLNHSLATLDCSHDPEHARRFQRAGRYGGYLNIRASQLHQALLTRVKQQAITLLLGYEIAALDVSRQWVQLSALHDCHVTQRVACRYVLACDGANSKTAKLAGIACNQRRYFMDFMTIACEGDLRPFVQDQAMLYWIYHASIVACMVALDIRKYQILQVPILAGMANHHWDDAHIRQMFAAICGVNQTQLQHTFSVESQWRLSTGVLAQAQVGNWLFFLGDALHQVLPAGGLGLNTGFADAHNLLWKLAQDRQSRRAVMAQTYAQERLPAAQAVVQQSIENYQRFMQMSATVTRVAPDVMIKAPRFLAEMPWVKQWWLHGVQILHESLLDSQSELDAALLKVKDQTEGIAMHGDIVYQGACVLTVAQRYYYHLGLPDKPQVGRRLLHGYCQYQGTTHALADWLCYQQWTLFYHVDKVEIIRVRQLLSCLACQYVGLTSLPDEDDGIGLQPGQIMVIRPDGFVAAIIDTLVPAQWDQFCVFAKSLQSIK